MSELEEFLQHQQLTDPESEGEITVASADMLKKYESLLPDYRDGLLFFFQAAERWKSTLVDVKVKRWTITLEIHVPPEARQAILELQDSPEIFDRLLPKTHPLFEIGHGYRALSAGNAKCRQTFEVCETGSRLWISHHDDRSTWRKFPLFSINVCRVYFSLKLKHRIWNRVETRIDTLPHPASLDYKKRILYGLEHVGEEPTDLKIGAHIVHLKRGSLLREGPLAETDFPVTEPGFPCLRLDHSHPDHEVLFFYETRRSLGAPQSYLVPVRHGIALEPIKHTVDLGRALIVFRADHLDTDFSGLKLLENNAYEQELQRCTQVALEALRQIYQVQSGYQPEMSRAQMLYNAAKWTVGVPLWMLLMTQGGGLIYASSKLLFWKAFYGASAVGGFHSYARYLPDPQKYTEAMRKIFLAWLAEPELLETLTKYEVEIEPPKFDDESEVDAIVADIVYGEGLPEGLEDEGDL